MSVAARSSLRVAVVHVHSGHLVIILVTAPIKQRESQATTLNPKKDSDIEAGDAGMAACSKPSIPQQLDGTLPDDLMEVYSPPRLVPVAQERGLRASLNGT